MVPSSVETSFFNHLLWSVFQSLLHNYMLKFIIDLCMQLSCTAGWTELLNLSSKILVEKFDWLEWHVTCVKNKSSGGDEYVIKEGDDELKAIQCMRHLHVQIDESSIFELTSFFFFYVMASGGLFSLVYITTHSP